INFFQEEGGNLCSSFFRFKKNDQGQSLVEFAIILPLLLLVLLGIIQFGIIFSSYITVTTAAREGARVAIVGADDITIKNKVTETVSASAFLNEIDSGDIEIEPESRIQKHMVTVTVNASAKIVVPFLNYLAGESFPISSSAKMRVEYVGAT
ncbi:MAG: TadE/TadG family type IV pilus assembly protein, partial [Dethiobacteria bacterium]